MITLYELLEVSENASNEVIEKAYKVLAKKYHPDLQPVDKRKEAEEKMKQINEAYETLMDSNKRSEYDQGLERIRKREELEKQKEYAKTVGNNQGYQQTTTTPNSNRVNNPYYNHNVNNYEYVNTRQGRPSYQVSKEYKKEYMKMKLRNIRDMLIAIGIILLIFVLLWFIPPTHRWMIDFYENNVLVKLIVDSIKSMWS